MNADARDQLERAGGRQDLALPSDRQCLFSIAASLKRMADMMEEDRKPRLELVLPDGVEEVTAKHRRLLLEGLEAERLVLERIASAIEAQRATTVQQGVVHESAVGVAETPEHGSRGPDNG